MKRNLRFYFALFFAKCTARVLKLIGRKGTSMPGSWAIILCPDFLARMPRPKTVIGITGTNGKTTVCNMVEDILDDNGCSYMCNRAGSNVNTGIASVLIANSDWLGRPARDLAVLELDERSSPRTLPWLRPDIMLCTNLFRDSYKRNAHVEFIADILNNSIPDTTRMVLNADDLLSSGLKQSLDGGHSNPRATFGIDPQPGESGKGHNIVQDIRICPKCGEPLDWDFIRYHHIGQAHCPKCGFASPVPDYRVTALDSENRVMTVEIKGQSYSFKLPNTNMINVYNSLAAIAVLCEFGLEPEKIAASMSRLTIVASRYDEKEINGRRRILHMAKEQNPIACSRAFENCRDMPGKKALFVLVNDNREADHSVENTAWLYDTDFEFFNDPGIKQIIVADPRHWDDLIRLRIAGIPEEKIVHLEDPLEMVNHLRLDEVDTVVLLYGVHCHSLPLVQRQVEEKLSQAAPLRTEEKEAAANEN